MVLKWQKSQNAYNFCHKNPTKERGRERGGGECWDKKYTQLKLSWRQKRKKKWFTQWLGSALKMRNTNDTSTKIDDTAFEILYHAIIIEQKRQFFFVFFKERMREEEEEDSFIYAPTVNFKGLYPTWCAFVCALSFGCCRFCVCVCWPFLRFFPCTFHHCQFFPTPIGRWVTGKSHKHTGKHLHAREQWITRTHHYWGKNNKQKKKDFNKNNH